MANKQGIITGNFYPGEGIKVAKNPLIGATEKKRRADEKEAAQKLLIEAKKAKQKELEDKAEVIEFLPQGNKIIILPYPENPYKKLMEGEIIVDGGEFFQNPDTGEWDKSAPGIMCGKIIEVGPQCKEAMVGDDIFYESRTVITVPFMGAGYVLTSEGNIHVFINEHLKEKRGK